MRRPVIIGAEVNDCDIRLRSTVWFYFEGLLGPNQVLRPIKNVETIFEERNDAGMRRFRRAHLIDRSVQQFVAELRIEGVGDRVELVAGESIRLVGDAHSAFSSFRDSIIA